MDEVHDYSSKNVNFCQICKDLHDKYGDEEREIDEPHEITPLESLNDNKKKRGYTATMNDFRTGSKLKLNPDYTGNSQLGAFDVYSDSEEDKKTSSSEKNNKKKRGYTATMNDFRTGSKLKLNPDYTGNSQLGAFDVYSDSEEDKHTTSSMKGGRRRKRSSRKMKKGSTRKMKKRSTRKRKTNRRK